MKRLGLYNLGQLEQGRTVTLEAASTSLCGVLAASKAGPVDMDAVNQATCRCSTVDLLP